MATYEKLVKNGHKVQVESAVRDGLGKNIANNYAKQNGAYEGLRSGLADNLVAQLGTTNTESYIFRTTGGSADVMGVKKVNKIVANTIKYNQLVQNGNFESKSIWVYVKCDYSVSNNVATIVPSNTQTSFRQSYNLDITHKFFLKYSIKYTLNETFKENFLGTTTTNTGTGKWETYERIGNPTAQATYFNIYDSDDTIRSTYQLKNVQLIDLTALGLDSISTLDEFYATDLGKIVKAGYYLPYSEGALLNTKIVGMKNVGYNAYDNENHTDFIKVVGGQNYTIEGTFTSVEVYDISKNLIDTITTTAISLPNKASFVKVIGGNDTTCLHLTWSGSRTGFEEHKVWNYPVSFEGHGINGIGDELYPDGHIVRKFGVRAYQSGDENDSSVLTDMTTTVYMLETPTTEQGIAYEQNQLCDDYGTEEFVYDSSVSIPTPVGHETFYQVNLQNFLQRVYQYVNGSPTDLAKTTEVGTKLYKHIVEITSGSDITDLIVVSNTSTTYSDISSLQSDFTNGKIVSVSGTNNNQNANNENVLNLVMAKVSGTAMFGVALIDAQNQGVRCLVLTGTLTDSVASV